MMHSALGAKFAASFVTRRKSQIFARISGLCRGAFQWEHKLKEGQGKESSICLSAGAKLGTCISLNKDDQ